MGNAAPFTTGLDPGRVEPAAVDCVSDLGSHGADDAYHRGDSTDLERLRPSGDVSAKRRRGRPQLPRDGSGNILRGEAPPERKSATGWLHQVETHLAGRDGLTDGQLPVKLAQAVIQKADGMPVLDVVSAFEKCENMALKLKAAKFLKDTSKGTIEELRHYAMTLMTKEDTDETPT